MKDFYYSANEKDRYEYSKIVRLYMHLCNNEINEFNEKLQTVNKENLVNIQNERFLNYCLIRYQHMMKEISDGECLDKLSSVCNYPEIQHYESFDFVDIISLLLIAEIEVKSEKTEALNLLNKVLTSPDLIYISSESRHILPGIYGTVSILLSRLKKYDKASSIAKSGIDYSIRQSNFSTLTHLYYVMCYTSLKMDRLKQSKIYAARAMANAISRGNKSEYNITYELIEKNLKVAPMSLFNLYKDELVNES